MKIEMVQVKLLILIKQNLLAKSFLKKGLIIAFKIFFQKIGILLLNPHIHYA